MCHEQSRVRTSKVERGSSRTLNQTCHRARAPVHDHSINCVTPEHRFSPVTFATKEFENLIVEGIICTRRKLRADQGKVAVWTCEKRAHHVRQAMSSNPYRGSNVFVLGNKSRHSYTSCICAKQQT